MSLVLLTLLYLGLYVAQSTKAQNESLPAPVITAQPRSIVLNNEPVTILCQGPPEAADYDIFKMRRVLSSPSSILKKTENTNTLSIQEMKPYLTGLYFCSYQSGEHRSPYSNDLHLVITGSYDKPTLRSMNGTLVASGDDVKLQCFSRDKFDEFILTKEEAPQFTQTKSSTAQDNVQQTTFHLNRVTSTQAGTYRCYGSLNTNPDVWSHPSDPLQLEVTGLNLAQSSEAQNGSLPPPVITAQPGTRILYKEPVTILCQGPPDAAAYEIYKMERVLSSPTTLQEKEKNSTLYIQEMKPYWTGLYRCSYKRGGQWSPLSEPLLLVMTGSCDKPTFMSMSGTVVASGDDVKLQCFSRIKFDKFILTKEEAPQFTRTKSSTAQDNGQQTTFHLDRVTSTQAGTYRCYGSFNTNPNVWSHPSDPLQLEVTGWNLAQNTQAQNGSYDKPTLSSMSGTVVASGHNVRLQCFSRIKFEAFILTKEDAPQFTQRKSSTAKDNGQQTTFHLDRVTSTEAGTYRCYGALSEDPNVWSHPSDPLQLEVRGPAGGSVSPVNQVRLYLAGLVLLALVVVLAETCYSDKRSFPGLR